MEGRGHTLRPNNRPWGNLQLAFKAKRDGSVQAASDPRGVDIAWY
jgi:hypothetical protein